MSSHLPLLREMFPNKIFLDVDDLAKILNLSKKHIYNLSSEKRLKVPLYKDKSMTDKIMVSIIDMANYLDGKLSPVVEEEKPKVQDMVKKRGRPRGAISKRQMAFQHQLSMAIVRVEVEEVFDGLNEKLEAYQLEDNQKPCSEKLEEWKLEFSSSLLASRNTLNYSLFQLNLPFKNKDKPKVKKI